MKSECHRCGEICCRCWRTNVPCFVVLILLIAHCLNGQTISLSALPVPTFKQQYLVWDSDKGASNRVSWGLARDAWTNGNRVVSSNSFPITNGWHYKVTSILNSIESTPALWPSNRFDRWIVQTSTNLVDWKDGFIWKTNLNLNCEYLRIRGELIEWR